MRKAIHREYLWESCTQQSMAQTLGLLEEYGVYGTSCTELTSVNPWHHTVRPNSLLQPYRPVSTPGLVLEAPTHLWLALASPDLRTLTPEHLH